MSFIVPYEVIAIDVDARYPAEYKRIVKYAAEKKRRGAKVIFWTSLPNNEIRRRTIEWCNLQGLYFDAVNENLPEVVEKLGYAPVKIWATQYIDNRNVFVCDENTGLDKDILMVDKEMIEYMIINRR